MLAYKAPAKEQLELSTWWGVSWVQGAALIALVLRLALLLPTPPPSVTATVALRLHLIVHLTSHHRLHLIVPKEGTGNPLQYSCLENPMDGGAQEATVHGVTKSRTRLSNFTSLQGRHTCWLYIDAWVVFICSAI